MGFQFYPNTYDPTAYVKFDDISRRNKIEFDEDYCFCSPSYKVKISNTWYDSIPGLELGKTYWVRSIQIDNSGSNIGTYKATTQYRVLGYAFPDMFNSKDTVFENSSSNLSHYYYDGNTRIHLYYDTVPTFNSPAFIDYSKGTVNPVSIETYRPNTHFYLKSSAKFRNDSLKEKIIRVNNLIKPYIILNNLNCTASPPTVDLYFHQYIGNLPYVDCKVFYLQNGKWDSAAITGSTTTRKLLIQDTGKIVIPYVLRYGNNADTFILRDTLVFANPIYGVWPKLSVSNNVDPNTFQIYQTGCNTKAEFYCYADSTLQNQIFSTTKTYTTNTNDNISLKFNMYENNVIRYRFERGGIGSPWFTFSRNDYDRYIYVSTLNSLVYESWSPAVGSVYTGKWIDIEIDTLEDFSSPFKRQVRMADVAGPPIPVMLGLNQYVRMRQTDGNYYSHWSQTFYKTNVTGKLSPPPGCNCNVPSISFSSFVLSNKKYFDIEFGSSPNNLKYKLLNNAYVQDSTDILVDSNIYARVRNRTLIDTGEWSEVVNCQLKNSLKYCVNPYVKFVGKINPSDTIHIDFVNRNPSNTLGNLLLIANKNKTIIGYKELDNSVSSLVLNTSGLPSNGYVSLIANCSNKSLLVPNYIWYPLSNNAAGTDETSTEKYFIYNANDKTFQSLLPQSHLQVYDMSGKLRAENSENSEYTSLGHLSSGIYLISLSTDYNRITAKIFID